MAQTLEALFSGWDAAQSRHFRDEQRAWRAEDLEWRDTVLRHKEETQLFK